MFHEYAHSQNKQQNLHNENVSGPGGWGGSNGER